MEQKHIEEERKLKRMMDKQMRAQIKREDRSRNVCSEGKVGSRKGQTFKTAKRTTASSDRDSKTKATRTRSNY